MGKLTQQEYEEPEIIIDEYYKYTVGEHFSDLPAIAKKLLFKLQIAIASCENKTCKNARNRFRKTININNVNLAKIQPFNSSKIAENYSQLSEALWLL